MKLQQLILFLVAAFILPACSKKELMKYDTEANVFFPHTNNIDTVGYSFAKDTVVKDTVQIVVRRIGKVTSENLYFKLRTDVSGTAIAGEDFEMPADTALYFQKDSASRSINVILKRSASLREKRRKIEFVLEANAAFATNMQTRVVGLDTINYHRLTVSVDDILLQPVWWSIFSADLGTFSRKKTEAFVAFLNGQLSYNTFVTSGSGHIVLVRAQSKLFQQYLNQKAAAGETIYEEDGTIMKMGANAQ